MTNTATTIQRIRELEQEPEDKTLVLPPDEADIVLNPKRKQIIHGIEEADPESLVELKDATDISHRSIISRHFKKLRERGIVTTVFNGAKRKPVLCYDTIVIEPIRDPEHPPGDGES